MILLGLWLILTGLLPLLNMKMSSTVTTGLAVLGIVAGIVILLDGKLPATAVGSDKKARPRRASVPD